MLNIYKDILMYIKKWQINIFNYIKNDIFGILCDVFFIYDQILGQN